MSTTLTSEPLVRPPRVIVAINLGPSQTLRQIGDVLYDLHHVVQAAERMTWGMIDLDSERRAEEAAYDDPLNAPTRVESVTYANPLETVLQLGASGAFVLALLRTIRDWEPGRRTASARATQAEQLAERERHRVRMMKAIADGVESEITSG